MKTIILCTLVLFAEQSFAQIGVVTLKKKEEVCLGQWYTVKGTQNAIFLRDEQKFADLALNRLLLPYGLSIEDGQANEEGDLLMWAVNSDNGFISIVYRMLKDDDTVFLMIRTEEVPKKEDVVFWYEKFFN
jgi:hypothetical protein